MLNRARFDTGHTLPSFVAYLLFTLDGQTGDALGLIPNWRCHSLTMWFANQLLFASTFDSPETMPLSIDFAPR